MRVIRGCWHGLVRPVSLLQRQRGQCINGRRNLSQVVLGIETSCDDTGAAVVDGETGRVLGEAIHKQTLVHTLHGGIHLPVARDLHKEHIDSVVSEAMAQAGLSYQDLDAIATTIKPGLPPSLIVGRDYGRDLALQYSKPFIPIHHMEAHTLTVRLTQQVEFPFLCLLASGGHCLLVLCEDIDQYKLLGYSLDDAPGEALDKGARSLNIRSLHEFISMSGGEAIEQLARDGDHMAYSFSKHGRPPMSKYRDSHFSFSGLKSALQFSITNFEEEHGLDGDTALPMPMLRDLCASYQHAIFQHILRRTHRALLYLDTVEAIPNHVRKTLVLSGGVGSNMVLRQWLQKLCTAVGGYEVVCPPPHLCTDNGIMIAWNGVERLRANKGILTRPEDISEVDIMHRCPLGEDVSQKLADMRIKIEKHIKMI